MTLRHWRVMAFALAGLWPGVSTADACECVTIGPSCQAAWTADAVFAGTVRSIDAAADAAGRVPGAAPMTVQFDIDQAFINSARGPAHLVYEPLSTCTYRFVAGQKYLVYASKDADGRLRASVCSRTRPLREAAEDLEYLTALPPPGIGGRVYGRVDEWVQQPADPHGVYGGPVENAVVTVRTATISRELTTDRDGRYEMTGLAPGPVTLSLVVPVGFATRGGGSEVEARLSDPRACVAADFTIAPAASASGVAVDVAGRPVAGVRVEAVAEELAAFRPKPFHTPARTGADGHFSFEHLPPGRYVFGTDITAGEFQKPSGPAIFLPGTAVSGEAKVFELNPGDRVDAGVLRLPAR